MAVQPFEDYQYKKNLKQWCKKQIIYNFNIYKMATNQTPNPDFFTTLTKDYFTVTFKGVLLFTICPLEQVEPRKQVMINVEHSRQQIAALQAGECTVPNAQNLYNQLTTI